MSSGFAQRDLLATCVWFLVPQRGTLCCTHNSRLFPGIESMLLKRFSINCIRWWMTSRTGLDCWGGESMDGIYQVDHHRISPSSIGKLDMRSQSAVAPCAAIYCIVETTDCR